MAPHMGCSDYPKQNQVVQELTAQRELHLETREQLEKGKKIISEEHWYLDLPELKERELHNR